METKKELIAHRDSKSPISEIYRTLRTNIQFMNTNKKIKTLLITSTFPGEGKSWVASNLAVTFAQTGNKVILIDADMRKGRQYSIFGVSPKPGLSDFLTDIEDKDVWEEDIEKYIKETEIENLSIIPAGKIPPNPSELLVEQQMAKLLDELKNIFDIIIIDGTPCELVTDSVILSSIVDSTLIVTAYKSTRKDSLKRIIKNIENVGGNLIGIVINKMPISTNKYYKNSYSSTDKNNLTKNEKGNKRNKRNKKNKKNKKNKDNIKNEYNKDTDTKTEINISLPEENQDLEKPDFLENNNE